MSAVLSAAIFRATSESIWLLDEEGGTVWANDRLLALLEETLDRVRTSNFFDFSVDDAAAECFRACTRTQTEQRCDMSFGKRGSFATADVRLIPYREEDSPAVVLAIVTDVTALRHAEAVMMHVVAEEGGVAQTELGDRERLVILASQVKAANKELEAFSYSVSHDLREPLRSIDGFSRIVMERYGPLLDERGKDYLGRVRAAAQRMAQLIADMLTLARFTRVEMTLEPVNVTQIARAVCADLAESQGDRRVVATVSEGLTTVGDPRLLRAVLTNLLGNAWKFTSKREVAQIGVTRSPSETDDVFCITDNGAGFEMKYVEKLFRPFQRLHNDADFAGTGVGLATVQRIVARHGGRVWAEAAVEEGARVFFSIPRTVPEESVS